MTLRGTTMYYASKERKSDEEAPKNGKKAGGNLASIILVPDSERMIYILDISGSMNSDAPQTLVKAESTIGGADPNAKTTKVDVLKRKMISELPKLQPHQFFTIILYNHKVLWWQKELIPANKDNIKKAQDYINHIEATGSTNTYAALEAAFNMAGRGSFDKSYESSVDTIVLVSDGMPSTGQYYVKYKSNDKGELRKQTSLAFLDAVLQLNKLRRIRINTIGVPPEPMDDILGGLAADHGGTYYYWEIK
jgi:hypothetical protein